MLPCFGWLGFAAKADTTKSGRPLTVIVCVAEFVLAFPRESVTVSDAVKVPGFAYWCDVVAVDWVTLFPSPKLNVYDAIVSPESGSEEPEASNDTLSGANPDVGFATSAAVGGVFTEMSTTAVLLLALPRESVTFKLATNCPPVL